MTPEEKKIHTDAKENVILKAGMQAALKELDGMAAILHIRGFTPQHWPIKEIVEAKKLLHQPNNEKPS